MTCRHTRIYAYERQVECAIRNGVSYYIISYHVVSCQDQTFFLPSNASAARSMNALNALICFKIPPSPLALLASDATRFSMSSKFAFPSSVWLEEDLPRSTASSMSCAVLLSTSCCYDGCQLSQGNVKYGALPPPRENPSREQFESHPSAKRPSLVLL